MDRERSLERKQAGSPVFHLRRSPLVFITILQNGLLRSSGISSVFVNMQLKLAFHRLFRRRRSLNDPEPGRAESGALGSGPGPVSYPSARSHRLGHFYYQFEDPDHNYNRNLSKTWFFGACTLVYSCKEGDNTRPAKGPPKCPKRFA